MAITKVSDGTLRKYDIGGGRWRWRGSFYVWFDDGTRKQYSKLLGECNPPTDEERAVMASRRTPTPRGKGAAKAKAGLADFRTETLAEVEAEQAEMALPDPARYTPAKFVRWYVDQRNLSPSTAEVYGYTIDKHLDGKAYPMLDKPVSKITAIDVLAWLDAMKGAEVGDSAREKALSKLNAAYRWAVKAGVVLFNPCAAVERPKVSRRRPNPIDEGQTARLNSALDALPATESNGDFTCAVRLALCTGMRRGELCGLRWQDVDGWQDDELVGQIHVRNVVAHKNGGTWLKDCPKNGTARDIPINADMRALLRERKAQQLEERVALGLGGDLSDVFVTGRADGTHMTPSCLSRRWNGFSDDFNIVGVSGERAHFHDLRHTFATHAITDGIDVATVASILGHRDGNVTLAFYAGYVPSKNAEAMEHMEGKFTARASSADVLPFDSKVG